MASLGLGLVDPALVDLHGVGADAEGPLLQYLADGGPEDVPEGVLAPGVAVEAHQHLDDGRVPLHHLLGLVHLHSGRKRRRVVGQWDLTGAEARATFVSLH